MRMGMDKEWGTEIELVAIADLLGTPILVTNDSADPEVIQNWIYPRSTKTTEVILIGFCHNHYYSLEGIHIIMMIIIVIVYATILYSR